MRRKVNEKLEVEFEEGIARTARMISASWGLNVCDGLRRMIFALRLSARLRSGRQEDRDLER
jgi:hypothetical protein